LRVLEIDPPAAGVVRRIFDLYLDGTGDRGIASLLNRDGMPCPAAHTPGQNRHRTGDGWQGSTVRAILDNPRYTGYAVFGRWQRTEMLLDPEDVAAGHITRFRKANREKVIRSRRPAHPAIVSVETFTQVALLRRSRAGSGLPSRARLDRTERQTVRPYPLRGLIRCDLCNRKMQASPRSFATYYRCMARTLAPGADALTAHPSSVTVREDKLVPRLNAWIGKLFAPEHRAETVAALVDAQAGGMEDQAGRDRARIRLADAEARLRRHQRAIEAGVEPAALVDAINAAQADRVSAKAELDQVPHAVRPLTAADIDGMLDKLGNIAVALDGARRDDLGEPYRGLRLEMRYEPTTRAVATTIRPLARVVNERVRGGT
jgi:hypothetical protein